MSERAAFRDEPSSLVCLGCGASADPRVVEVLLCAACLGRHHPGCWKGACGGCGVPESLGPVRARSDEVRVVAPVRPRRRVKRLRVAALLVALGLGVWLGQRSAPPVAAIDARPGCVAVLVAALPKPSAPAPVVREELPLRAPDAYFDHLAAARASVGRRLFETARSDYDLALALWAQDARVLVERGDVRLRLRDAAGAADDATRALVLAPDLIDALFLRGRARGDLREWDGALADWDRVLALAPGDPMAHNNRAFALAHGLGRLDDAVDAATRAIALSPGLAYAWNNRAWAKLLLGDVDGAAADVERALQLDSRNPWAFETRAGVRAARGDAWSAVSDLRRCLELDPRYPRREEVERELTRTSARSP
jgi:regulator of sirC expression with transglutaminase-like and TPR domain